MTSSPGEEHPLILRLIDAKRAAIEAMAPSERDELKAVVGKLRAASKARRKERHARRRAIVSLWFDGASIDDISGAVNVSAPQIVRIGESIGIAISRSPVNRCIAAPVLDARIEALHRAAIDYGASARQTVQDLLDFALDDDAAILRRVLRIARKGEAAG